MKNSQKGFVIPLLISIIVVLIIGGGIYISTIKKSEAPVLPPVTDVQTTSQVQQQTNVVTNVPNNTPSQNQSVALTKQDILNATYSIKPNLGISGAVARPVVFPARTNDNPFLTNVVWFKSNGTLAGVNVDPGAGEAFYIERYEFINSDQTQAKVYVGGNYGATAFDNRVFIVRKINGKISTEEIS